MHGAFAVGSGDLGDAVDADLDDGGRHLALDGGLFVDDLVADEVERVGVLAEYLFHQQHKAGFRRLVLVPRQRPLFQRRHDLAHLLAVFVEGREIALQLIVDGALAGNFRKQKLALVADDGGVDVFEGRGIFQHPVGVHARLVGKGVHADVGLVVGHGGVGRFGDGHGAAVHVFQVFGLDAFVPALELQIADDGGEVGVAAPLAEAQKGALHLLCARLHRLDGVRHRQPAVVVAVDGDDDVGEALAHGAGDAVRFVREDAAVGIAQAQAVGARLGGARQSRHGVPLVRLIAVKKVLGVKDDLLPLRGEEANAVVDHLQIFFGRGLQNVRRVADVALAEDGHIVGARR